MGRQELLANWKTQSRKGFLDLCILNCLNIRKFYGYDLVQTLKQFDGATIREGLVYPILARMQSDGLVTSEKRASSSGPPRKYYQISETGRELLDEMNGHWRAMIAVVEDISTLIGKEQGDA